MNHRILLIILAFSGFILSGCATTSYKPSDGSEYGKIRTEGDRKGLFVWNQIELLNIDGVHVGDLWYGGQYYKIEEGERRIRVSYLGNRGLASSSFLAAGPIDLHANIQNGVKYEVVGEFTDERVVIFIREVKSKKIVSEKIEEEIRYERIPSTRPIFIPINQ